MDQWNIQLQEIGFFECPENWHFKRKMTYYDLLVFRQGEGIWKGPDGSAVSETNTCLLLEKGKSYTAKRIKGKKQRYYFIHYDYVDNNGNIIVPNPDMVPFLSTIPNDFNLLYELANRCFEAYQRTNGEWEASVWLKTILLSLLEQKRIIKQELSENAIRINKLCLEIKDNIAKKWRLDEMAKTVGLSTDHFAATFKKYMNVSPGEWVINSRINQAKTLLRYDIKSISQIAENLGYCDIYAFSKQFKKITGLTPKQFRNLQ